MAPRSNWYLDKVPRCSLVTSRDLTPADFAHCLDKLNATGEQFEWLDRAEGGFCVKGGNDDGMKQIRLCALTHYNLVNNGTPVNQHLGEWAQVSLRFQGGHRAPSEPWTRKQAVKLRDIITEALELKKAPKDPLRALALRKLACKK